MSDGFLTRDDSPQLPQQPRGHGATLGLGNMNGEERDNSEVDDFEFDFQPPDVDEKLIQELLDHQGEPTQQQQQRLEVIMSLIESHDEWKAAYRKLAERKAGELAENEAGNSVGEER